MAANGPQAGSNVYIQSPGGVSVMGPTAAASALSLTLGSASGSVNTLNLGTGPISVTGPGGTTINAKGFLDVGAGSFQTTSLSIAGAASVGSGGSLAASSNGSVGSGGAESQRRQLRSRAVAEHQRHCERR